ncbi:MAG: YkgJ family cysteine cluster protein, partial [Pseudomonadota bacterium]
MTELPDALRDRKQLEKDDEFCFGCNPELDCFTRCCSDINIPLTPVDVFQLSRKLGIDTNEFLSNHALTPITKDLHLPVVLLRMGDDPDKNCPFVGEKGCSVYDARPWSCRMYPVGMALPPARAGEEPEPIYYLLDDDFCDGHKEGKTWTTETWRNNQ